MHTYQCIIAPIKNPTQESTVVVDATGPEMALIESWKLNPDTFVKSVVDITTATSTPTVALATQP